MFPFERDIFIAFFEKQVEEENKRIKENMEQGNYG